MHLSETLALMEHAAREAGVSLLRYFSNRDELKIDTKKAGDFVSQADREAEQTIVGILRAARPTWGILGEEGTNEAASVDGYRWIIDPLDGTTNFLHGVPNWCVTIALEKDNEIVAAMTFDATRDELFYAEKGQGTFLNGSQVNVSTEDDPESCISAIDSAWYKEDDMKYLGEVWYKSYAATASTLCVGAAALTLAYTAIGRVDVSHVTGVQTWDVAAGILLIREAGGVVTDLALNQAHHSKGETIAGNPALHEKYIKIIGLK